MNVSVVIVSCHARDALQRCLQALSTQPDIQQVEIIVAVSGQDGSVELVRKQYPSVQLLSFQELLSIPELRGRAIAQTMGDIIAILDPYAIVDSDWLSALRQAHQAHPHWVIGGAVDLFQAEQSGWPAWACYLNEYGMFMPPVLAGEVDILPGCNISYKRPALFAGHHPWHDLFWKTFVNWDLQASDHSLWLDPAIKVSLYKPIPFGDFLLTRYHHGRCFAGMRVAGVSPPKRLLRALTTPILPALLLWRSGRRYWRKKRRRARFLFSLPLQGLLFGTWALGEFAGYLFGPGHSCARLLY